MIKKMLFLLILNLSFTATLQASKLEVQSADPNTQIVILVRHAEKQADQEKDPSLTPAGRLRAIQLDEILRNMPLTALYATPFKRTKETLKPISESREMTIQVIDVKEGISKHVSRGVENIRAEKGNVLVVGHSNTIPLLIKALGGPEIDDIAETDYESIYLLSLPTVGNVGLVQTKYGK